MDRVNRALLQYAQQAAAANPTESDAVVEEEEEVEVEPPKPEDAADIILRLIEEKAYFEIFGLPAPRMNALDRPTWDVTDSELSRAFRRKSLRIHPDKNPDPKAREAFDALNDLYQKLQEPITREEWVREAATRAKRMERLSWKPTGDLDQELGQLTAHTTERRQLEKQEASSFAAQIAEQVKQKRMRSKYKSACVRASRQNQQDSESEEDKPAPVAAVVQEDSDEESRAAIRSAKMRANANRRKKPKIIS